MRLTRTPAERLQNRILEGKLGDSMLEYNSHAKGMDPRALQMASIMVFYSFGGCQLIDLWW
jgi:hypothetical protein